MSIAQRQITILSSDTLTFTTACIILILTTIILNKRIRLLIGSYAARFLTTIRSKFSGNITTRGAGVSALYVYPVKSLRGVKVSNHKWDRFGLEWDRRLMIVQRNPTPVHGEFVKGEATHSFLTQRQIPSLATVDASLPSDPCQSITLSSHLLPNESVTIDLSDETLLSHPKRIISRIWDDTVELIDVGDDAATFVQKIVRFNDPSRADARVVAFSPTLSRRTVDANFVPLASMHSGSLPRVALSDGYPVLIACEASLEELNRRIAADGGEPVPMSRFRPNIVVRGTEPFEEDYWKTVRIGKRVFHVVKGCPRCKQSCTDQLTGERFEEPLATLATFRALGTTKDDVYFATNAIFQDTHGVIHVGDPVTVLTTGTPTWND